jgi:hypothetical protein
LASANNRNGAETMWRNLQRFVPSAVELVLADAAKPTEVSRFSKDVVFVVMARARESRQPCATPPFDVSPDEPDPPERAGLARHAKRGRVEAVRRYLAQYRGCDVAYMGAADAGLTPVQLTRTDVHSMFLVASKPGTTDGRIAHDLDRRAGTRIGADDGGPFGQPNRDSGPS